MMDFEPAIQNSVREIFPNAKINGCYFHFVKILWGKAKKYGLCTKKDMKYTKILLFVLKLMPYMSIDERDELFENIEKFYGEISNNKYAKLIRYYKKNWKNNNYINYIDLTEKEYLNRTNNYLENFHHIMNQKIEVYHPKLSYLVSKYKEFILYIYSNMKDYLVINNQNKKVEKFTIINDIYTFLKKYNTKYKTNLNIHCIIQGVSGDFDLIYKVCDYLLEMFFNLDIEDNIDKKDKVEESDESDIENNIIPEYEEFTSELLKVSDDEDKEDSSNDILVIDEFYPQKLDKKKKKRNYNDVIGEANELKKFNEVLILNRNNNKLNS